MEVYIWENLGKYRKSMEIPEKKEVFFRKIMEFIREFSSTPCLITGG